MIHGMRGDGFKTNGDCSKGAGGGGENQTVFAGRISNGVCEEKGVFKR